MGEIRNLIRNIGHCTYGSDQMMNTLDSVGSHIESGFWDIHKRLASLEQSHEHVPEPLPCDKNGEPKGGLKKFDLIWHEAWNTPGIFDYADGERIYGWWAKSDKPQESYGYDDYGVLRKDVTFVLRPEKQSCFLEE